LTDCCIGGSGLNQTARFLSSSIKSYVIKACHGGV
jgi:hypothetical protein